MKLKLASISYLAALCLLSAAMTSCSSDDNSINTPKPIDPNIPGSEVLRLESNYATTRLQVLQINPDLSKLNNPELTWKITQINDTKVDSLLSNAASLDYITLQDGVYTISVDAQDELNKIHAKFNINVALEETEYSAYISKVTDFLSSVGQFTNKLPKYEPGDTHESMVDKVDKLLSNNKNGLITLGGFGGYVEFKFDHTIMNVAGKKDFEVFGNAGSPEPAIIEVAYDANKNGIADPEEWFEIAGSEYNHETTIKNYEITFYKPSQELDDQKGYIDQYIKWEDNQGQSGYKVKNVYHAQSYFPLWVTEDKITFKGTKLRDNYTNIGENGAEYWTPETFEFGYADVYRKNDPKAGIDIGWAVDQEGNSVKLPGIDFVRVYGGVNQEAGWIGEVSAEISGAIDLHLKK